MTFRGIFIHDFKLTALGAELESPETALGNNRSRISTAATVIFCRNQQERH
jgi:hypothetical protein